MSFSPELDPNPRKRCTKIPPCFANAFAQVPWPAPNAGNQSSLASTRYLLRFFHLCSNLPSTPFCHIVLVSVINGYCVALLRRPSDRSQEVGDREKEWKTKKRIGDLYRVSKIVLFGPLPTICSNRFH